MTLKVHVIEATSDPVGAPNFVGQHWINTATNRQWLSYGTSGVGDWLENFTGAVLDEQVRDVIAAAVQDSSSIDFTNNDVGDTMSLAVIPGGVNHDALSNFVANEHIDHSAVNMTAGTGLTGGGDITTSRTFNIANTGVSANTYQSPTTITSFTVNAQGQITGATNNFIAIPSTQVTDFNEAAQDAVGGILTDSSSVDFTYSDGGNSIQAAVIPGGVDHNGLANLTTGNPHTQYLLSSAAATTYQPLDSDLTAVAGLAGTGLVTRTGTGTATTRTLTAGTGMTVTNGDGVSGNPTVAITNTAVTAGTYGNNAVVPQITVNAQGQITNVANSNIAIGAANITDFAEQVDDRVDALVAAGTGISKTYNDAGNTLTIANTDTGSAAVATHVAAGDPHPQYLTATEGNAAYQPLDADLSAVAALGANGFLVRTGPGGAAIRTLAAGTGIGITNTDGVAGSPTITNSDTGSSAVSTHVGLSDPHTQYQLEANLQADVRTTPLTGYTPTAGTISATDTILQAFQKVGSSLSTFAADVRSVVLTGLSIVNSAVTAADSILVAIGKLQGQINDLIATDNQWTELRKASDTIVNSNVTLTNITDLGFTVTAGRTYYLEYTLMFRTAATATGFAVSLNTSNTAVGEGALIVNMPIAADGTAALYSGTINAFGDVVTGTGVQTANPSWFICNMKGIFRCTTTGTLVPQFRSEVNGSNVNCGAGSVVLAREF
jgi:hypothetical protein